MFDGFVYLIDPFAGTFTNVFDCETIVPHIEVPVRSGMTQILAMPKTGDGLLFGSFEAWQVSCTMFPTGCIRCGPASSTWRWAPALTILP